MAAPVLPRKLVDRYEIRQILGSGGVGQAYVALDTATSQQVALKILPQASELNTLELFYHDYGLLSAIAHANIAPVLEFGELDGDRKPYFVTALLQGMTLEDLIRIASHRLSLDRTIDIVSQVSCGLQAAHEHGLVHGDLKPSNIFVTDDNDVKIIDFGILKLMSSDAARSQKRNLLYMSPEQISGQSLTAASDTFSLSVVCYEALTGRQPFRRLKQEDIANAILQQMPPLASELNSVVNQAISQVLRKGMAKRPEERFPSALGLRDELNRALRNEPLAAIDSWMASSDLGANEPLNQLVREGQELCASGQFSEGIRRLRQAFELDAGNQMARSALCVALVARAQRLVGVDWKVAEDLLRQALEIDPGNSLARTIRAQVFEHQRDSLVEECISRAKRLQSAGDLEAALARIEEGLATYLSDPRLIQMRDHLQEHLTARREARLPDVEALLRFQSGSGKAKPASSPEQDYLDYQRLPRNLPRSVSSSSETKAPADTSANDGDSVVGATRIFSPKDKPANDLPPPAFRSTDWSPLAKTGPAPDSAREVLEPAPQAPEPEASFRSRVALRRQALALGAGLMLLLALFAVKLIHRRPPPPPLMSVHLRTSPTGATIRVNNQVRGISDLDLDLPAGNFQIDAELDGYQPASTALEVKPGGPNSSDIILAPILPELTLIADTNGEVWLDDQPAVEVEGTHWTAENLVSGVHQLKFSGSRSKVAFTFEVGTDAPPAIKGNWTAQNTHVILISQLGNQLHVSGRDMSAKLSLDGSPAIDAGTTGVDFRDVTPGTHKLIVNFGLDRRTLDLSVGTKRALTVFLLSDEDIGSLLVVTGMDNAQVYLNGQQQKKATQNGQLRITDLRPKDYLVKVSKLGYQEAPEQRVAVHKGEQARLVFTLQPVSHPTFLSIKNATPGSEVLIDQAVAGTVQPDGALQVSVVPGDHVVQLRKDHFEPRTLTQRFSQGQTVLLTGPEVILAPALGQLKIIFSPADALVTLSQPEAAAIKVTSNTPLDLAPGAYELRASVGNYPRSTRVEVAAGETRTIGPLSLAPRGIDDFEDSAAWKLNKEWFARRGGDFVLFKDVPPSGKFVFSAVVEKGHRLQWVFNYLDNQNYELFQIDDNDFYRSAVRKGENTQEVKVSLKTDKSKTSFAEKIKTPFKSDKRKTRTFSILVTSHHIVHMIQEGDGWMNLDSWEPGRDFNSGKFGFYIPGSDEVELSNFNYWPDLKLP
jgi:tetratricopeptide (TPR) repeat protein